MNFSKWFTKAPSWDDFASRFRSSQLMIFSFKKSSVCLHLGNVMIRGSTFLGDFLEKIHFEKPFFGYFTKLLAW